MPLVTFTVLIRATHTLWGKKTTQLFIFNNMPGCQSLSESFHNSKCWVLRYNVRRFMPAYMKIVRRYFPTFLRLSSVRFLPRFRPLWVQTAENVQPQNGDALRFKKVRRQEKSSIFSSDDVNIKESPLTQRFISLYRNTASRQAPWISWRGFSLYRSEQQFSPTPLYAVVLRL